MVRFKNRYLLFEIQPIKSPVDLTEKDIADVSFLYCSI